MTVLAAFGIWKSPSCLVKQLLQTIQHRFLLLYATEKKKPAVSTAYHLRQPPRSVSLCALHLQQASSGVER